MVIWGRPDGRLLSARRPVGGSWRQPVQIAPPGDLVVALAAATRERRIPGRLHPWRLPGRRRRRHVVVGHGRDGRLDH
ncbi:MAG: hypothetical protein R2734_10805 [Nocardioides sp.]